MTDNYQKQKTILVIDDNEDDYEAIARAFRKVGMSNNVSLCNTGQMAMDFLKHEGKFQEEKADRPALIMLDLNMPGMDGMQVLGRIRKDENLKQIPVVIWTTSSNEKDIDACYALGANAYMQKPVIFDDLVASIRRLKEYWFETAFLPSNA